MNVMAGKSLYLALALPFFALLIKVFNLFNSQDFLLMYNLIKSLKLL